MESRIIHLQFDIGIGTYNVHNLPREYVATYNPDKVTCEICKRFLTGDLKMENEMLENICTLVDLMERAGCQLEALVNHAGLMNESLKEMLGDTKSINQNICQASLGLKALAEAATKADEAPTESFVDSAGKAVDEALEGQAALDMGDEAIAAKMSNPVHLVCHKDGIKRAFALCGAPYSADLPDVLTIEDNNVTCPECLAKMAAQKKS